MGAQRGARVRDPAVTKSGKDWFSASSIRLFQCQYTRLLNRWQVEFTTVHDDTSRQYCEHVGLTTGNKNPAVSHSVPLIRRLRLHIGRACAQARVHVSTNLGGM